MSNTDCLGQGTLPPSLEQRVQSELSSGERLVYVGQPRPELLRGQALAMSLIGCIFIGFVVFMGYTLGITRSAADAFRQAAAGKVFDCLGSALCPLVFCVPFLLIAGFMAAAPVLLPRRLRRVIYALTDRRTVIFEPHWFVKGYTIRSYTPAALSGMFPMEQRNGAGDLIFELYFAGKGIDRRGFMAIENVREIEELVRQTLQL